MSDLLDQRVQKVRRILELQSQIATLQEIIKEKQAEVERIEAEIKANNLIPPLSDQEDDESFILYGMECPACGEWDCTNRDCIDSLTDLAQAR